MVTTDFFQHPAGASRHDRFTATLDNVGSSAFRSATLHAGRLVYDTGGQRCEVRVVIDKDRVALLRPEGAVTFAVLQPAARCRPS